MNHPDSIQAFYDALAAEYTLLFADWRASVQRRRDATCGIGTRAIGLRDIRWLEPEESGF